MESLDHSFTNTVLEPTARMVISRSSPIDQESSRGHPGPTNGHILDSKKSRRKPQEPPFKRLPIQDSQWHRRAEVWRGSGRSVLSHGFLDTLEDRR